MITHQQGRLPALRLGNLFVIVQPGPKPSRTVCHLPTGVTSATENANSRWNNEVKYAFLNHVEAET